VGHLGIKEGAGFVPVADPTAVLFDAPEEHGALLTGIAMVLLLAGLSMTFATIRCWIQNRSDLGGFSRHATKIIPKGVTFRLVSPAVLQRRRQNRSRSCRRLLV
jgi:hypothetical protein